MHPSDRKPVLLPHCPSLLIPIPHQLLRKLLVGELASCITEFARVPVCLEEGGKFGFFSTCPIHYSCSIFVRIKANQMVAREMDLQANNIGELVVHVEMEDLPYSFGSSNEPSIDVFADLVVTLHFK